jgi:hypothetical protein
MAGISAPIFMSNLHQGKIKGYTNYSNLRIENVYRNHMNYTSIEMEILENI